MEAIVKEVRDLLLGSQNGELSNEAYIRSTELEPIVAIYCSPKNATVILEKIASHTPEAIREGNVAFVQEGREETFLVIKGSKALKTWLENDKGKPTDLARTAMEMHGNLRDAQRAESLSDAAEKAATTGRANPQKPNGNRHH